MCRAGMELQETPTAGLPHKQQQHAQQQAGSCHTRPTSTMYMKSRRLHVSSSQSIIL